MTLGVNQDLDEEEQRDMVARINVNAKRREMEGGEPIPAARFLIHSSLEQHGERLCVASTRPVRWACGEADGRGRAPTKQPKKGRSRTPA